MQDGGLSTLLLSFVPHYPQSPSLAFSPNPSETKSQRTCYSKENLHHSSMKFGFFKGSV